MVLVHGVLGGLLQGRGRGGCWSRKHMDGALLWEITALRFIQGTNSDNCHQLLIITAYPTFHLVIHVF